MDGGSSGSECDNSSNVEQVTTTNGQLEIGLNLAFAGCRDDGNQIIIPKMSMGPVVVTWTLW